MMAPWPGINRGTDDTVPVEEARMLYAAAGDPKELRIVRGGDNGIGGRRPFQGPRPAVIEAMNATQGWFRRHLANGPQ